MPKITDKFRPLLIDDKVYFSLLALAMTMGTWFNYNSTTMQGMLHYYEEFGKLIRDGIYTSNYYKTAGSFPMWGYGFVYALTGNKLLIILSQVIVSYTVLVLYDRYMRKSLLTPKYFYNYRLIVLFSFPLFFFHSILWPYSFSSSFLLFGLLFLADSLEHPNRRTRVFLLFGSASAIGVSLNFRSDYLLCFFCIYVILLLFAIMRKKETAKQSFYLTGWFILVLIFLLPWALYTKKVTGHYLVNSTNAGHVLYIGLGQLPDNKWNIEPYDEDTTMRNTIVNNLHPAVFSTTTYSSDSLLKKEWFRKISNDPVEYVKKCGYVFLSVFIQPFSEGDRFKQALTREDLSFIRENMRKMEFRSVLRFFADKASFSLFVSVFAAFWGIAIHLLFWIVLLRNIKKIPNSIRHNPMAGLGLIMIFYQVALLTAGYYHRNYNTNIYLLYIVVFLMILQNSERKLIPDR